MAQNKYWISFKSKSAKNFDPYSFFDPKTIENRKISGLPLTDWYDLPVDMDNIKIVTALSDSIGNSSRWLNGIAVFSSPNRIERISKLPFVKEIELMNNYGKPATITKEKPDTVNKERKVHDQIDGLEGDQLAAHGLSGKGIRIAVLDVGFINADKHPAFKYLRDHEGIKMTYDFLHKKTNVFNYGAHGTAVLSCIAGKYEGYRMGLAPDAEFLLARTEREGSEFIDEEDAWVAAAEWAEQHGAQMISSSLGYTYQRYFYKDMNGHTSIVSRGASLAARKGILICNAAGNEGVDQWKFIITPADCDSVLTVGGYDPTTGYHIGFSSFGPTPDKRLKPNVIASGRAWVATPKSFGYEEGTSFSTPLMTGFVACVWQWMRNKSNMEIFHTVESMGSLYPYYDYAHGYGIPKASYLFNKHTANDTAFTLYLEDNKVMVSIATSYFKDTANAKGKMKDIETEVSISIPNDVSIKQTKSYLKNKYLYAKIIDPEGNIKMYDVIKVDSQRFELNTFTKYLYEERQLFPWDADNNARYPNDWTVKVFFDNCIRTYKF